LFDSKEIARRALALAEKIKNQRNHRRKRMLSAAITLTACTSVVIFTITGNIFPMVNMPGDDFTNDINDADEFFWSEELFVIEDNAVPLSQFPPFPEDEPSIIIPEFGSIIIPVNADDINALLLNPEENDCYMSFQIILTDTGESLYASEMIAPGTSIENIVLSRMLQQGEYRAGMIIRAYAPENFTEIHSTKIEIDLIAE
jgi:hypothetical protein